MKNSEIINATNEIFKKHQTFLIVRYAVIFLMIAVASCIPLVNFLVAPLTTYYFNTMVLRLVRSDKGEFKIDPNIVLALKIIIISFISLTVTSIGFILFIIPGLIAYAYIIQTDFVLCDDNHLNIFEVLEKSINLMKGKILRLLLLLWEIYKWPTLFALIPVLALVLATRLTNLSAFIILPLMVALIPICGLFVGYVIFIIFPKSHVAMALFYEHNVKSQDSKVEYTEC